MGEQIFSGRYTTDNDEDIVVFLIGMRINKILAVWKWFPVMLSMPSMISELNENKNLGFISMESYFGLRTTVMIQYWKSTEELIAYAKGQKHLKAWKAFNEKVGNNDAVGIYHETYVVSKGKYESLYGNMPLYGLAKAMKHIPIQSKINTASKRLANER